MAKVMVSLPDDLLAEVDAEARRRGTTRSAVMRDFADAALRRRRENRAAAIRSLLSDPSPHGGRSNSSQPGESGRPAGARDIRPIIGAAYER
ncbi:MAG: ribbon-helix-helix domain-containing protein [Candidatus Promineofilum sp.]|nr:ribbon-helix-helix domain-containing protein [Promineifilum sp.]